MDYLQLLKDNKAILAVHTKSHKRDQGVFDAKLAYYEDQNGFGLISNAETVAKDKDGNDVELVSALTRQPLSECKATEIDPADFDLADVCDAHQLEATCVNASTVAGEDAFIVMSKAQKAQLGSINDPFSANKMRWEVKAEDDKKDDDKKEDDKKDDKEESTAESGAETKTGTEDAGSQDSSEKSTESKKEGEESSEEAKKQCAEDKDKKDDDKKEDDKKDEDKEESGKSSKEKSKGDDDKDDKEEKPKDDGDGKEEDDGEKVEGKDDKDKKEDKKDDKEESSAESKPDISTAAEDKPVNLAEYAKSKQLSYHWVSDDDSSIGVFAGGHLIGEIAKGAPYYSLVKDGDEGTLTAIQKSVDESGLSAGLEPVCTLKQINASESHRLNEEVIASVARHSMKSELATYKGLYEKTQMMVAASTCVGHFPQKELSNFYNRLIENITTSAGLTKEAAKTVVDDVYVNALPSFMNALHASVMEVMKSDNPEAELAALEKIVDANKDSNALFAFKQLAPAEKATDNSGAGNEESSEETPSSLPDQPPAESSTPAADATATEGGAGDGNAETASAKGLRSLGSMFESVDKNSSSIEKSSIDGSNTGTKETAGTSLFFGRLPGVKAA